jgi:hypothetical protein
MDKVKSDEWDPWNWRMLAEQLEGERKILRRRIIQGMLTQLEDMAETPSGLVDYFKERLLSYLRVDVQSRQSMLADHVECEKLLLPSSIGLT